MPPFPDLAPTAAPLPATLPDGTPWPRVAVLVVGPDGSADAGVTAVSVAGQGYPDLAAIARSAPAPDAGDLGASAPLAPCEGSHAEAAGDAAPRGTHDCRASFEAELRSASQDEEGCWLLPGFRDRGGAEYLILLRPGDRLVPGALAALVLTAWIEEADAVAGLRVLCDGGRAEAVDVARSLGPEHDFTPSSGVLFRRAALGRTALRLARIGRPVLLTQATTAGRAPASRPLRIAALNDAGPSGGAGIAHRRLVEALRLAGHAVTTHALNAESPGVAAEWTDAFPATEAAILAEAPDLVLAGNIHGATRTSAVLERLHARVPVAAVLHDLFLLTGRCAHPDPGNRLASGCDALCPTPDLYPQLARPRIGPAHAAKRRFLAAAPPPLLLANSRWTEERARALAPAGARVSRVGLAFPTQVFRPGDKRALRRSLGLPEDGRLILFGAVIADQPSKGAADLVAALRQIAGPGIGFVAIGRIDDPRAFPLPNLTVLGPIADEAELAACYGACDLHVTASRLETLGQTAIEAGLCGTPTVAYRETGLTTAIIDGVSGMLVEPNPGALAAAIRDLLADPGRLADLGRWGRIALESRNSYAAAALGLGEAFTTLGVRPASGDSRVGLSTDVLGAFAPTLPRDARPERAARPAAKPLVGAARRIKQRLWGRARPLWMRRALYAAHWLRGRAAGRGSGSRRG